MFEIRNSKSLLLVPTESLPPRLLIILLVLLTSHPCSSDPIEEEFPEPWNDQWTPFQRILMIRALRPDKIVPAVQKYVMDVVGAKYVEPQPFNLSLIFQESTNASPLVFILSPGSDPLSDLLKFAEDRGNRVESVSLGQGQVSSCDV